MTAEQKEALKLFLFKHTPLWHNEDINKITGWVEENISKENELLKQALIKSVEVIKYWHDIAAHLNGKTPFVVGEIWQTFYDNAPEMKIIREVLKEKVKV